MSESTPQNSRTIPLPAKVVVSLRAGFILAIANILCVAILAWAYTSTKNGPQVISVTGSAKKTISSDLIVWEGKISTNNANLVQGYTDLKSSISKAMAYLKAQRIDDGAIELSAVQTKKNFARDNEGHPTDKITSYDLVETVRITSNNVDLIANVARTVTGLIQQGVNIESEPPQYFYTKLADLKISMLAAATKDATARAEQIAQNSGATLGTIHDADMGVLQINPVHSSDISGYGNNDTSSLKKDIIAVVHAKFDLK
jgi:hypothetical protein